jgi:hypothetical protein
VTDADSELIAQQLSAIATKVDALERRLVEVDKVTARLEGAALITGRALREISAHWDAVYEAMRRAEDEIPEMRQDPDVGQL